MRRRCLGAMKIKINECFELYQNKRIHTLVNLDVLDDELGGVESLDLYKTDQHL